MKKSKMDLSCRGKDGFDYYYSEIYASRWISLKEALAKENVYCKWQVQNAQPYFLDPASVFAALQLPLENAKRLLDLCAAPGGKTLVIAACMDEDAELVSNERSAARKQRLLNVCNSCLPQEISKRIHITCKDGAKLCLNKEVSYDRILLDAPCSSERHIFTDEKYLNQWSKSRIKSIAIEQWALLSSAYRLLEKNGYLLYSTCSFNPTENDEIIKRLIKKFADVQIIYKDKNSIEIEKDISKFCSSPFLQSQNNSSDSCIKPEKSEYGFYILPDTQKGAGPIWFSLIQKK